MSGGGSAAQVSPHALPGPAAWRCSKCCGPHDSTHPQCYACFAIFRDADPRVISYAVPLSAAPEIGPWYGALKAYKQTDRALVEPLGRMVGDFLGLHEMRLVELLGGPPDLIAPVPSTRGVLPRHQPLFSVAQRAARRPDFDLRAEAALEHVPGVQKPRRTLEPGLYRLRPGLDVRGARIIVLEDSWASGACAVSAAHALCVSGAAAAVVMPIARLFSENYWMTKEPGRRYRAAMDAPWDPNAWPHG